MRQKETATVKITINEHASVRLETADGIIYFDPFNIVGKPADADYIFITHAHFDHYSPKDIKKTANKNTAFIVPESMLDEVSDTLKDNVTALAPFDEKEIGSIKIEAVPAYNTNKPMHKKEYGWLGYVVTVEDKRIYVCGDMDATDEGVKVDCDTAFVPVGGTYTMNVSEAADFINRMKPETAIPYHYGSIVGGRDCGEEFKALVSKDINVELYI